jgi:DNA polymerase-3 subunit gamma/tau
MTTAKYQVLARRFRPQRFEEVIGQEAIITTLKNALLFEKTAHAYLFSGSRGVGKTTLARLFAKAINCQAKENGYEPCNRCPSCIEILNNSSLDIIEIDGASNRGIDDIRQINETALYAPSQGKFKIYIIDEVHMLTKEAFNALLKTLEEPPETAKFFFATTEPHKIPPTIISRCQRFDLGRIELVQMTAKLNAIATSCNRTIEPEALHLIATFADGSLRDAESLLDQIFVFADGQIGAEAVRETLGLVSQDLFFALDIAFQEANVAFAFELVETICAKGKDLSHFLEQLIQHIRLLTLAKTSGERNLHLPSDLKAKYITHAQFYASSQCLYLFEYLLKVEANLSKSTSPRVSLEAALLHYIQSKHRIPIEVIARRLIELEQALGSSPKPPQPELPPVSPPTMIQELVSKITTVEASKKASPEPIAPPPPPLPKIEAPKPVQLKEPIASKVLSEKTTPHHASHYDTLIRFTAVELEGSVQLSKRNS